MIAGALFILSFATVKAKKQPVISNVIPSVGSPGDTMVIRGSGFGQNRGSSFVEIGGSRVTASSYLVWTDGMIKLVIPTNVQDGLIIVHTSSGKSKPDFFANETGIPVAVSNESRTSLPVISTISPASAGYGTLLTISGANFGSVRGNGSVLFSANREDSAVQQQSHGDKTGELNLQYIAANSGDFDYEYWSDSEIRVRIPDGAATGPVIISTEKGDSNAGELTVTVDSNIKKYHSRKTFVVQVNADVENINSKSSTNITLRMPKPVLSALQPLAELTECVPEPVLADFKNTVVYRFELAKANRKKHRQNYIISTYGLQTNIDPKNVKNYSEKERNLYKTFTAPDSLIHSDDKNLIELSQKITGKEKNPYLKAKLIYDFMVQNYSLADTLRKADLPPEDLLKSKKGDAYDFSIIYTALLRAAEIPAASLSGVLVESDLATKNHWWNEFYIEGYGWIPVDIALAKGLSYKAFRTVEAPEQFYFGNIDGQHISFSKGWNELKQTISENSKIVYRPKTYALQSIWEESSEGTVNYSSLWTDPVVLGVY